MKRAPNLIYKGRASASRQRGVSLVEILVGLTVGLIVLAVALGGIMVSRQIASTTSEATRLQQQAAYALRVIGNQLRQAGSLELNLAFNQDKPVDNTLQPIDPADPVAFMATFDRKQKMLGTSADRPLQIGYAFYKERLTSDSQKPQSQLRDCLGAEPSGAEVSSTFFLVKESSNAPTGELRCLGSKTGEGAQALIKDVADFRVSWLRQQVVAGAPVLDRVDGATASTEWRKIYAAEVCIELEGSERIDTGSSTYRPCSWKLGDKEAARNNRLRLVFRNTIQFRTQAAL